MEVLFLRFRDEQEYERAIVWACHLLDAEDTKEAQHSCLGSPDEGHRTWTVAGPQEFENSPSSSSLVFHRRGIACNPKSLPQHSESTSPHKQLNTLPFRVRTMELPIFQDRYGVRTDLRVQTQRHQKIVWRIELFCLQLVVAMETVGTILNTSQSRTA